MESIVVLRILCDFSSNIRLIAGAHCSQFIRCCAGQTALYIRAPSAPELIAMWFAGSQLGGFGSRVEYLMENHRGQKFLSRHRK
jgi:hypothetical protein